MHALAPSSEYVPATHDTHAPAEVRPSAVEYVPGVHPGAHMLPPATPKNVPAGHGAHALTPARDEYAPAAHGAHVDPALEYEPTAQGVQSAPCDCPS